jgi:hypothetical protein
MLQIHFVVKCEVCLRFWLLEVEHESPCFSHIFLTYRSVYEYRRFYKDDHSRLRSHIVVLNRLSLHLFVSR